MESSFPSLSQSLLVITIVRPPHLLLNTKCDSQSLHFLPSSSSSFSISAFWSLPNLLVFFPMGCGVSRVEANDNIAPLRFLPFRRRIDDIRQRRNGRPVINDGTLSSKQLLHEEEEDGHTCPTDDAPDSAIRKSVSSPPDSETSVGSRKGQSTPIKDATETETGKDDSEKKKTPDSDGKSKTTVVPAEEKTEGDVEKDIREGKDEEHQGEKEQDDGTGTGTGSGCGRDSDDDEGEGGSPDADGREIAPGSPSFRDFFVSAASNAEDTDSGDAGIGEGE